MPETYIGGRNTAGRGRNPLRDPRDRRLNRIAGPASLVLFGVTGDLARKKLMPAVYDLANRGLLPPSFALVGFARREWENEDFAAEVKESVKAYARTPFDETVWKQLSEGIRFVQGEFDDDEAFKRLSDTIDELDEQRGTRGNHAFYLSIPPKAFEQVCRQLSKHGLAQAAGDNWRRVVIEKPFGHDLESARQLNDSDLPFMMTCSSCRRTSTDSRSKQKRRRPAVTRLAESTLNSSSSPLENTIDMRSRRRSKFSRGGNGTSAEPTASELPSMIAPENTSG